MWRNGGGQHCKTCGCAQFIQDLEPFYNTFSKWLSKYGYYTCACGKLHHQGMDQMQGWTQRIGGDMHVADQFLDREEGVNTNWNRGDHKWSDAKEVARAGVGRQHGVWEKLKFFEGSVRTPLVLRAPKRFGKTVVDDNVSACDLYATLCDFAGVPVPEDLESRSLIPLADGTVTEWNDEVISHYQTSMGHEPNLMIKRGKLKYQSYGGLYEEVLFDLERDPEERENFMKDERYQEEIISFRKRAVELGYKY